jgi:hypothetical protein
MTLEQLELRSQIHHVFAASLRAALAGLWNRSLTDSEILTVDSSTLCCSFMDLEALEARLTHTGTVGMAYETFCYLVRSVAEGRADVVRSLAGLAAKLDISVDAPAHGNLLTFEDELLQRLRRRILPLR